MISSSPDKGAPRGWWLIITRRSNGVVIKDLEILKVGGK